MADQKITDLPAGTRVRADDLFEVVQDVVGTPTSKQVSLEEIIPGPDLPPAVGNTESDEFDGVALDAKWVWINQGTATATVSASRLALKALAVSGNTFKILKQASSATPYTITVKFNFAVINVLNFETMGIVLRESSTGKFLLAGVHYNSSVGGLLAILLRYNSPTSLNGNYPGIPIIVPAGHVPRTALYFRVVDNGTTVVCSYSWDGVIFYQFESQTRTAFLASGPDEIGLGVNSDQTSFDTVMLVDWFRRS